MASRRLIKGQNAFATFRSLAMKMSDSNQIPRIKFLYFQESNSTINAWFPLWVNVR